MPVQDLLPGTRTHLAHSTRDAFELLKECNIHGGWKSIETYQKIRNNVINEFKHVLVRSESFSGIEHDLFKENYL